MKKFLAIGGLAVLASIGAYGTACAGVSTASGSTGTLLNDTVDTCTLTTGQAFTNFSVFLGTGFNSSAFSLSVTAAGTQLQFSTTTLVGQDIVIYFSTTPGINFVTLQAGAGDSVVEGICSSKPTEASGSEVCPSGSFLNTSSLSSTNGTISTSAVTGSTTDWFIKDDSGGSSLTQTFIPEPMTFSLMGVGLVGLGFLGRRLRK